MSEPTVQEHMAAIKAHADNVVRLLEAPEWGLFTWNMMVAKELKDLRTAITALIGETA